jgi:type IV pilus assembly protein PilC
MEEFTYKATDSKTGEKITAEIEANDEVSATKILVARGLSPLEIKRKAEINGPLGGFRNRVPAKERVIFSRQLSTLINAGLPLVQSLSTVGQQSHNKTLKEIIRRVINDVEAGSSFSDSLAKYPRVFDTVYISLVAAGEASGTLDTSLERLANQQEKDAEIVSKVRGAMIYPLIVLLVLGGVVVFLMTTVLPQVKTLYKGIPGAKLPFVTTLLLSVANFLIHFWWLIIIVAVGGAFVIMRWLRTSSGRSTLDGLKMRVWPVKDLFMKLYMARFARTAGTLVGSGVPMIKMLNTTAEAVGNVHVAKSITDATEQVKGGKSLSESLKGDPNFLQLVPDMIHTGEQSGALEDMLSRLADYYEREVDNQIKSVSTLIEPVLMIVVGIIALVVVAAVLLPIYSLAGKNLTNI